MFEGLQCFSSVKGSFSFTHIRGGIGGEEGEWVGVGLRGEVVLLQLWSLPGGTRALLAGKEADSRVLRAWELGWEKAFETNAHIGIRKKSCYSAATSSLYNTNSHTYSQKTRLHIQAHKHRLRTSCIHVFPQIQHTLPQTTHFGFLFNFESTRWLVVGDSGSSDIQDKYQQGVEWLEAQGRGEITEPDDSLIIIDMMCSIHYTDYLL